MMGVIEGSTIRNRLSSFYPIISPEKRKNRNLPSIINHSSGGCHVAVDSIQFFIELYLIIVALLNYQLASVIEKFQPKVVVKSNQKMPVTT